MISTLFSRKPFLTTVFASEEYGNPLDPTRNKPPRLAALIRPVLGCPSILQTISFPILKVGEDKDSYGYLSASSRERWLLHLQAKIQRE
jgi:hypothetical protein